MIQQIPKGVETIVLICSIPCIFGVIVIILALLLDLFNPKGPPK